MERAVPLALAALCGCGRLAFDPSSGCPAQTEQSVTGPATFVSPTGSNTNAGTETEPWATIAYALANAPAGDHIVLLDGTYSERLFIHRQSDPCP